MKRPGVAAAAPGLCALSQTGTLPSGCEVPPMRSVTLFLIGVLALVTCLACRGQEPAAPGNNADEAPPAAAAVAPRERLDALRQRLAEVEAAGPGANAAVYRGNLPVAKLHLEKATLYPQWDAARAAEALAAAEKALDALAAGRDLFAGATGLLERAYIAPSDNSVQPYWVYRPKGPAPQTGWPLLVYLHGYVPDTSKINPWLPDDDFWQLAEEHGFLVAVPYGRRNTDFEGIGEQDVLIALEEVQRAYPVDADRVFLGGPSMGGYGVYVIGLHSPHLFAGLAPMCGRSVPYVIENRYPDGIPAFKRIAAEANTPLALVENARNLPIFLQQGELDYLINPEHSRRLAARWKELGYSIRYEEWQGHDHYIYWEREAHAAVFRWAKEVRRVRAPREVVYVTYTPKYGRAYWVRVEGLSQWGKPARIEARIEADNRITVTSSNVTAFTLEPPPDLVDPKQPLVVVTNGRRETHADWQPGQPLTVTLEKAAAGLRKHAALCGPVRETCLSPFLLVPGTRGDAADQERLADWAKRWATEWRAFADGEPTIKPDIEVTEEEIRTHNLILFGERATNAVLARIAARLPVERTPTGYRLGEKETPAADLGLLMVYPNPLAPERLVCVYSGEYWGDGLDINHKLDLAPDFIFFRNELDGADPARTPRAVSCGYFDGRWRLSPELSWTP